ncbi:MAG: hypothetical protein ACE37J_09035 [Pikeienuella sp.]|uniref:hypothetical protein n=1 Tax=Pikeienuella sp. TaxID=2831957 RepID=UPI00391CAF95
MMHVTETRAKAGAFRLAFRKGRGKRALDCWLALPAEAEAGAPPLIALHGIARDAEAQACAHAPGAAAAGRAVIAPLFDEARWGGYQRVKPNRADRALLSLLDELEDEGLLETRRFDLSGFSGGAQFAHRFAMLYPERVRRLTLAAPGFWTFPDEAPFPYGFGGEWGAKLASGFDRMLGLDIAVFVGADDDQRDENMRAAPGIDAQQGPNRRARAGAWVAALKAAAAERGLPAPRLSLTVAPGLGHDFDACAADGALINLAHRG